MGSRRLALGCALLSFILVALVTLVRLHQRPDELQCEWLVVMAGGESSEDIFLDCEAGTEASPDSTLIDDEDWTSRYTREEKRLRHEIRLECLPLGETTKADWQQERFTNATSSATGAVECVGHSGAGKTTLMRSMAAAAAASSSSRQSRSSIHLHKFNMSGGCKRTFMYQTDPDSAPAPVPFTYFHSEMKISLGQQYTAMLGQGEEHPGQLHLKDLISGAQSPDMPVLGARIK